MIRNANRNISVSKGHGYTVEKVKYALDFINSSNRNKTLDDWVAVYNHIKGTNETAQGCQACKAAKFTAAVRNYAQYGYLTLINEGHKPEEFTNQPKVEEPVEEVSAETYVEEKKVEELNETSAEACNEEQQVPELFNEVKPLFNEVKPLAEATENDCEPEKQSETVVEETSPETCNDQEQVEEVAEDQQQWEKLDESIIEQGVDAVIEKISETPIKKRGRKAKK